jgi:hypothetical protein
VLSRWDRERVYAADVLHRCRDALTTARERVEERSARSDSGEDSDGAQLPPPEPLQPPPPPEPPRVKAWAGARAPLFPPPPPPLPPPLPLDDWQWSAGFTGESGSLPDRCPTP